MRLFESLYSFFVSNETENTNPLIDNLDNQPDNGRVLDLIPLEEIEYVPVSFISESYLNKEEYFNKENYYNTAMFDLGISTRQWPNELSYNQGNLLDRELWLIMMSFLNAGSIVHLSQSCKYLYNIVFADKNTIEMLKKCKGPRSYAPTVSVWTRRILDTPLNKYEKQDVEQPGEKGFILRKFS